MSGRTTMRQIAASANVSVATVSMALRGSDKITPETRDRVQTVARELGYQFAPKRLARPARVAPSPATNGGVIAYVTAYPTKDGWYENRFCPAAYEGARLRASQRGYTLEHFWLNEENLGARRLAKLLHSRGITGLCVAPFPDVVPQFTFPWEGFCPAAIGYTMRRPALHRACPHQFQGMSLALQSLRKQGYRRVGVALGQRVSKIVAKNWIGAVLLFQYTYGRNAATCLVYEESDREELKDWMRTNKPDAMIVSDIALIPWIEAIGVRVPEEMGVVPLEVFPGHAYLDQKPGIVGAAAIDLVIGQMQRGETGLPADPKIVMVEGAWVDGPSVRHLPVR